MNDYFTSLYCIDRELRKGLVSSPLEMILLYFLLLITGCSGHTEYITETVPVSRVIILTDMLNEADDSQTMVRLLMYANRMDIEGLIAVSSCHQYSGKVDPNPDRNSVHPGEIRKFVRTYSQVYEQLEKHEEGWPPPEKLMAHIGAGPPEFGMMGVGKGKSTSGSRLICEALLEPDPRPLYVCVNAGASCLAQALFDLSDSLDRETFRGVTSGLRIYDDAGQDDAGAWIAGTFPHIRYQRSSTQVFSFYSGNGPVTWDTACYPGEGQHKWARKHVQMNHGPLGALYPTRMRWAHPEEFSTLEGGGTSTWIGHVNRGLYVPEEMTWGGWGGRFKDRKVKDLLADDQLKWAGLEGAEEQFTPFYMFPADADRWTDPETGITWNDTGTPIYRWRRAYQNDFEGRMDWCVQPYEKANHNPVAAVYDDKSDAIIHVIAHPGHSVRLDASASTDPDRDRLSYRWYTYPEAGTYDGTIQIQRSSSSRSRIHVPADAAGKTIHVILEVRDLNPIISMYDYRRVVIKVITR